MGRLKKLTSNWRLKLFSLFISILAFLFVSVEYSTVVDVEYPIDYRTGDNLIITTTDRPSTLRVTLRGPWATFRSFSDPPPVVIDLAGEEPGPLPLRRSIQNDWIKAPAGMTVVSLRPAELELSLDQRVEKLVPVEPYLQGRPAFGYEIAETKIEPPRVRVAGPLSEIRTLDFVNTEPIDLAERTEGLKVEAKLKRPSALVKYIDRTSVTVSVKLEEEIETRDLELSVRVDNGPPGAHAIPTVVKITLKGPRALVSRLEKDALVAAVDVAADIGGGRLSVDKAITILPSLPERSKVVGDLPRVTVILSGGRRN